MKKILVTGATGLLGARLVPELKLYGNEVATTARSGEVTFKVDLTNWHATNEMLTTFMPDLIINLASLTSVELCQNDPNQAYRSNTLVVEMLVRWIENRNIKPHLVQISTDHVYDGEGLNDEADICLRNVYAFSKYAGELAAARVPSSIIRTNFIGKSAVDYRQSLSDWVYKSLSEGKSVEVLDDVFFNPVSINTLVSIIRQIIDVRPVGTFNLGANGIMSKADLDFLLAKYFDLSPFAMTRIKSADAKFLKAFRPKNMTMNSSKIEKILGIKLPDLETEVMKVAKEYEKII